MAQVRKGAWCPQDRGPAAGAGMGRGPMPGSSSSSFWFDTVVPPDGIHISKERKKRGRDDQYFGDGTVQDPLVAGEKGGGQVTPHTCWMYICRLETEHYRQHERKCMPRSRLIQGCSAQDQEELEAPVAARCTQGKLSRNKASYLATMVLGVGTSILTTRHRRWLST